MNMDKEKEKINIGAGLWKRVCTTPTSITKKVRTSAGFITTIDPQSRVSAATRIFGPAGIGWGVKNESFDFVGEAHETLCIYQGVLWYIYQGQEGSFPIAHSMHLFSTKNVKRDPNGKPLVQPDTKDGKIYYRQEDMVKMVKTGALMKGLSYLGFNSDVYEGKFRDNAYYAQSQLMEQQEQKVEKILSKSVFEKLKLDKAIERNMAQGDDESKVRAKLSTIYTRITPEADRLISKYISYYSLNTPKEEKDVEVEV